MYLLFRGLKFGYRAFFGVTKYNGKSCSNNPPRGNEGIYVIQVESIKHNQKFRNSSIRGCMHCTKILNIYIPRNETAGLVTNLYIDESVSDLYLECGNWETEHYMYCNCVFERTRPRSFISGKA
jgi:hypothetical protein